MFVNKTSILRQTDKHQDLHHKPHRVLNVKRSFHLTSWSHWKAFHQMFHTNRELICSRRSRHRNLFWPISHRCQSSDRSRSECGSKASMACQLKFNFWMRFADYRVLPSVIVFEYAQSSDKRSSLLQGVFMESVPSLGKTFSEGHVTFASETPINNNDVIVDGHCESTVAGGCVFASFQPHVDLNNHSYNFKLIVFLRNL